MRPVLQTVRRSVAPTAKIPTTLILSAQFLRIQMQEPWDWMSLCQLLCVWSRPVELLVGSEGEISSHLWTRWVHRISVPVIGHSCPILAAARMMAWFTHLRRAGNTGLLCSCEQVFHSWVRICHFPNSELCSAARYNKTRDTGRLPGMDPIATKTDRPSSMPQILTESSTSMVVGSGLRVR